MFDPADKETEAAVQRVNRAVVELEHSMAMGDPATGEHGAGMGKLAFVADEHGASLEYMKRIKRALDP
jgi:D-lactate dehydrogenase (cytochrome)